MSIETKTWAERFPHPGAEPPVPGPCPEKADCNDETTLRAAVGAWDDVAQVRMLWVAAFRRYTVAKSLDVLRDAEEVAGGLSPADLIAYVLGVEYLTDDRNLKVMFDKGVP